MTRMTEHQQAEMFPHPGWTGADSVAATTEGWDIWEADSDTTGPYQLQRRDDMIGFDHDTQAWDHVVKQARLGSGLHRKAISFIYRHSPTEAKAIRNRTGCTGWVD